MAVTIIKSNAVNDIASTNEDTLITIAVLANDIPTAAPKTLVSLSGVASSLGASIKIVNGKVVYDPTNDPTIQALAAGETAKDTFTYIMKEGAKLYTATVTVNLTGVNDPPVISGTTSGQATSDTIAIRPFATASVSDVDHNAQDSLTITLVDSNGNVTDANGTLSGSGLTETGVGTYSLAATNPSSLTTELQGLTFTPTAHEGAAGSTVETTFDVVATDQFNATVTNNSTTVVATQSAAPPNPTIIGYGATIITVPNTTDFIGGRTNDINNSGEMVGSYFLMTPGTVGNETRYGFTVINGVFSTVLAPGSSDTNIEEVNNKGDYAGYYGSNVEQTIPFVFHNSHYINIPVGDGFDTFVTGLNDNGQITVVTSTPTSVRLSYIFDEDTGNLTPVTSNAGETTSLTDINNSGVAVGSVTVNSNGDRLGFIYDSVMNLKLEFGMSNPGGGGNAKDVTAAAINDKGDIVGTLIGTDGSVHGYLALGAYANGAFNFTNIVDLGSLTTPTDVNNNDLVVGSNPAGQKMFVNGGSLTLNQTLDITPNAFAGGQILAVNDSNVLVGQLSGSTATSPIFANPIVV